MTLPPDPRTAPDEPVETGPDVGNRGISSDEPAEGADDEPAGQPGSPEG